jgi:hypothetical protein
MGDIYNEGGNSVSLVTYYQDTPLEDKGSPLNAFIPGMVLTLANACVSHAPLL